MPVPSASTTELDGALGIHAPTTGLMQVILGPSTSGAKNTPAAYQKSSDVKSNFGLGPAVEAACYAVDKFGMPVVFVRTDASTVASFGALDATAFTGTATPTLGATVTPNDNYEVYILFVAGGALGTAGITYKYSLDGGRTMSPLQSLGTATTITIPDSGSVEVDLGVAAGTVLAGDILQFTCTAATWDSTDLQTALAAVKTSTLAWEFVHVVGDIDATSAGVVSTFLTDLHNLGEHHWAMGSYRIPTVGETDAAYQTAFSTEFGAFSDTSMMVVAGGAKVQSTISSRQYRRSPSFWLAPLAASVSSERDLAEIDLGPAPGVSIRDANGNPDEHDEYANPGLDDLRACVLRTWPGRIGVFVDNPTLVSPVGSDFLFLQHRRVMNEARNLINPFMAKELSKPLRVNPKTGFLQESELVSIEKAANALLIGELMTKPKVSSVQLVLSRNDPVLTPPFPITGQLRMVPLAYPKTISIEVAFNGGGQ